MGSVFGTDGNGLGGLPGLESSKSVVEFKFAFRNTLKLFSFG